MAVDIISQLPELEWRGLTAPCSTASYSIAFDLAPRAYYGIDGFGHDNTGRQSAVFPVTLWFLNSIREGAFPDLHQQWVEACVNDKSPDWLLHPLLGLTRARVQSFAVDCNANLRDGVKVDAVFVETIENLDQRYPFIGPNVSPEAAAEAAETSMAAVGVSYPQPSVAGVSQATQGPPTLEQATSLTQAYAAVKGQLFSASLTATSAINKLLGIVATIIEDIESLKSHDAWAARWNVITFFNSLKRIQKDAERLVARATSVRTLERDMTLDEFAAKVGNTLIDVMSLNVQALRSPIVLKGETLRFYTGTARLAA